MSWPTAGTGKNGWHGVVGLLRQSVYGRLAGYEDVNDADRLGRDPAMRWVVGGKAAERLLRNLARRLEHEEPGVSGSILEGLDEILTVIRLGLTHELRRSLACTNIVENALGTVRQVTRNVKRWRHAEMALRWTAAGLLEAQKTFRRLKAYRQLPILRNALQEHLRKAQADSAIETIMKAA